jgi:hypothetical protein
MTKTGFNGSSTALFRLSVLGPLVSRETLGRGELSQLISNIAQHEYTIPGSQRRYVGEKTIHGWYYAWRRDGIKGLEPKIRTDRGQSRLAPEVQAAIINAKRENPKRSIMKIIELMRTNEQVAHAILNRSTVHRLLQAHNLSHQPSALGAHIDGVNEFFKHTENSTSSREDMLPPYRWMLNLLQCQYDAVVLQNELGDKVTRLEIEEFLCHIREGSLRLRNRAVAVVAHIKKIPNFGVAQVLAITPKQVGSLLRAVS